MYDKPLPVVDHDSVPFWDALREQRLLIKRCADCTKSHFYPRILCPHCHSERVEWVDAMGLGTIYTFTVARRPAGPSFKDVVPYVVALITLDEGPRMMTRLLCDSPESVRIGQRVQVKFERVTSEFTLPFFRPLST